MPIFQDDFDRDDNESLPPPPRVAFHPDGPPRALPLMPIDPVPTLTRRLSEESIRTDLCEGPVPDSPTLQQERKATTVEITPERPTSAVTSDRAELIERLKRGESPTWIPNRHLESILHQHHGPLSSPKSPRSATNSPILLPPADITSGRPDGSLVEREEEERLREGLNIERPRSALHSGDFTPEAGSRDGHSPEQSQHKEEEANGAFAVEQAPWLATSPPRDFTPFQFDRRIPFPVQTGDSRSGVSSLSSSLSSSFVYKPPTSPLVQSEVNEDIDLSIPLNSIAIASAANSPSPNPRRHTLHSATSSPFVFPPPSSRSPMPNRQTLQHRRESSLPYQAHQPRRSLTSTPNISFTGTSPQTPPFLRSRRPSFSSDASPLQASMVGSYEESILRGRMSTHPSKPLDFLAQIGVLGLGKCKASLRCPPHVTLPFPAVFYSYGSTPSHMRPRVGAVEDGPSPYVGQIDLENGLPNPEDELRTKRKMHSRYAEQRKPHGDEATDDVDMADPASLSISNDVNANEDGEITVRTRTRAAARSKRRSGSPKAPPGGSYRIPEKGQIQIVIKNQNKTAVKLFLVPYDLAGMEPGTKTFIRQRSYSAGPIIEGVPPPIPADAMGDMTAANTARLAAERPILRYLVHLHICCPSRGRFYLYKSIRIVFANRVPDGKEKLRNETTWPEPRFAPYKPIRVMHPPNGPGATLAAEKAFRRRSSGWSFAAHSAFDLIDGVMPKVSQSLHGAIGTGPTVKDGPVSRPLSMLSIASSFGDTGFSFADDTEPIDPIPFRLPSRNRDHRAGSDLSESTDVTTSTLPAGNDGRPLTQDSMVGGAFLYTNNSNANTVAWSSDGEASAATYEKLSKGDVGYGGNAFALLPSRAGNTAGGAGATESLLSQRLRSLGTRGQDPAKPSGETDGAVD